MLKRIGNLTVATIGVNIGVYYNHTPYQTTLLGFNPFGKWHFGPSRTPGVKAFAAGPVVVGRFNLADVGKSR
jgi:hypothetical protein